MRLRRRCFLLEPVCCVSYGEALRQLFFPVGSRGATPKPALRLYVRVSVVTSFRVGKHWPLLRPNVVSGVSPQIT